MNKKTTRKGASRPVKIALIERDKADKAYSRATGMKPGRSKGKQKNS